MGSSSWSTEFYTTSAVKRKKAGTSAFDYTDSIRAGKVASKTHDDLNPMGIKVRESRDSDEHPNSNAIGIMFDVTGSMGRIPVELQKKLAGLMGLLVRKDYITDPQLLFGAIGDVRARDTSPLQVGQFESGNEMEGDLSKIFIESGGGGNTGESYDLAMWFFANKTSIDCFEKRGDKGYLFTIGDEPFFDQIRKNDVKEVFGDDLQGNESIESVVEKLKEKYNYFHILPDKGYHSHSSIKGWKELLGQNVLTLDDSDAVCETIALAIGVTQDSVDLDTGTVDLLDEGYDKASIESATRAVSDIAKNKGMIIKGNLPPAVDDGSVSRL